MVWYVRGGGVPEKHREGGNIKGDNETAYTMNRLQGGSHRGVYDGVSEANVREGARH